MYPIMTHIVTIGMLMKRSSDVLTKSEQLEAAGMPAYCGIPLTFEDLNWAFALLKFHIRHMSSKKAVRYTRIRGLENGGFIHSMGKAYN